MNETERLAEIRQNLIATFDEGDLRTLCSDLSVDYDLLPGDNKAGKARELLARLDRTGRIPELITKLSVLRPNIQWRELLAAAEAESPFDTHLPQAPGSVTGPGALAQGPIIGNAGTVNQHFGDNVDTRGGDYVTGDKNVYLGEAAYNVAGLPNPFLGLRAFGYADRDAYAGRRKSIAEAVDKLTHPGEERTVLFITGASGSGKSSFAQAGLVPALQQFYAERHYEAPFAVFRPAKHPMAMLKDALLQAGGPDLAHRPAGADPILLIVDQFEELFTQSQAAERDALLAWIAGLPPFTQSRAHVIATLRSDYLKELFDAKPVWDLARDNSTELREMTVDELKDAIQRPLQVHPDANAKRKRFEPALLDRLAQDASASATLLPLLQVTLEELWKQGQLMLANYGTLTDAIKQRADQVLAFRDYDAASPSQPRSPDEQAAVLATFLDLVSVTLDEDPRQVRVSREVEALSPERRTLVDDLTRARLLSVTTATGTETVSIIHESLISNWQRLKAAVAQERDQLQQRARFEAALREWEGQGRQAGYLLSGVWLAQARALEKQRDVALQSDEAKAFLRASNDAEATEKERELAQARALAEEQRLRAEAERQRAMQQAQDNRRLRQRALLLAGALAIAAVLAIAAFVFGQQATENAATAQAASTVAVSEQNRANAQAAIAKSQALGAQAVANQERALDLSLLLSVQAINVTSTFEARSDLLNTVQFSPLLLTYGRGHTASVTSVAFSPDGKTLASGSDDKTVILWDVTNPSAPKALGPPLHGHSASVTSVAFSPDGKTLASGSDDTTVILWDLRADRAAPKAIGQPLTGHSASVSSVAFSPDGKTLASGSADKTVILWDVADRAAPKPIGQPLTGHSASVSSVAFSPDGKTLASSGEVEDNTVILWDVADRAAPKPIGRPLRGHTNSVASVAFSPDGKTLASGSDDTTVILWDVADRVAPKAIGQPLRGHSSSSVAFSPDGKTLASGSGIEDNTVILWDVADRAAPKPLGQPLRGHTANVASVAFSPDGKTLASGSWDYTVIVWDMDPSSWMRRACHIANRNLTRVEWRQYMGDEPYRKTCPDAPEGQ